MILLIGGLILFFKSVKQGDFEHADRLSLLPLEEDDTPAVKSPMSTGLNKETEGKSSSPDNVSK